MKRLLVALLLFASPVYAQDHADTVRMVKDELVARGADLSGGCGAFQITKRVAWLLRSQGYRLLWKGGGFNCDGYATDYLISLPSGVGFDILGDGGGQNAPQWIGPEDDPGLVARNLANYREASDPGDAVTPAPVPPAPVPVPPVPSLSIDTQRILDAIAAHDAKDDQHWADAKRTVAGYLGQFSVFFLKWIAPALAGVGLGMATN